VLILLCTLDLAMPVAPTPRGVEFEEDEEVLHLGGFRLSRPAEAADRRDVAATPRVGAQRVGAAPALRALATGRPTHAPRIRLVADPPPAPSASGEDH
jgi:hypothetical protein